MCLILAVAMRTPRFTLRGFRRPREAVLQSLGSLEREVMEVVWRRGKTSVRDAQAVFGERVAYTTLMTTLDRLYRKGLLKRRKEGQAYHYTPRVSREQFAQGVVREVIEGLLAQAVGATGTSPVLACIVETLTDYDRELLTELDQLVKEKRREIKEEGE